MRNSTLRITGHITATEVAVRVVGLDGCARFSGQGRGSGANRRTKKEGLLPGSHW